MANIKTYEAPIQTVRPDEKAYAALETAGRRVEGIYSNAAAAISRTGAAEALGLVQTGRTAIAIADLLRPPPVGAPAAKTASFRVRDPKAAREIGQGAKTLADAMNTGTDYGGGGTLIKPHFITNNDSPIGYDPLTGEYTSPEDRAGASGGADKAYGPSMGAAPNFDIHVDPSGPGLLQRLGEWYYGVAPSASADLPPSPIPYDTPAPPQDAPSIGPPAAPAWVDPGITTQAQ